MGGEAGQAGVAVSRTGVCFDEVVDLHGWAVLALSDVEAGDWSERFDGGVWVAASEQEEAQRAARKLVQRSQPGGDLARLGLRCKSQITPPSRPRPAATYATEPRA